MPKAGTVVKWSKLEEAGLEPADLGVTDGARIVGVNLARERGLVKTDTGYEFRWLEKDQVKLVLKALKGVGA